MPKWGHHSSASGSDSGHRNYDAFARAPFVDLASLILSPSYHLGQIWVKTLLEPIMALPGSKVEKLHKKHILSLMKVVGHNAVYSHWNTCSPLIFSCRCAITMCYKYFINFCQERPPSIQETKLILLTCFSQSRFQN